MTLQEKLQDDLKDAMRSGDTTRRSVIRYLRAQIHNQEIASQGPLDDQDIAVLLSKQAQQRRDSMEAFQKGNRTDLVEKEQAELDIILGYLPQQMSDEEIGDLVRQAIQQVAAVGPRDMGKVMGALMPQLRGTADGKRVSALVSQLLQDQDA